MESTVLCEGRQTQEHEPSDIPRSASTQIPSHRIWEHAAEGAAGVPGEDYRRHSYLVGGQLLAAGPRSRFRRVLLFSLIPALIVSVLRTICRTSTSASTEAATGPFIRRLSESEEGRQEDNTLAELLELCGAVEWEATASTSLEDSAGHQREVAERVARIALSLYEDSLAFEKQMRQSQSAVHPSLPALPANPASPEIPYQHHRPARTFRMPGPQLDSPSNLHLQSGITASDTQPAGLPSDPMAAPTGPLGEDSQPLPSVPPPLGDPTPFDWPPQVALPILQSDSAALQAFAGTQPPVVASNSVGLPHQVATLLPQAAAWRASDEEGSTELSSGTYPELDPESWLDALPVIGSLPESSIDSHESSSQGQPPEFSRPACQVYSGTTETWLSGQGFPTASSSVPDEAAAPAAAGAASDEVVATAAPPSTTAAVSVAGLICMHPFVRLPILQEGVVPPPIVLNSSHFDVSNRAPLRELLLGFRHMFMRKELDKADAAFLVQHIQDLAMASAARARSTRRMSRPVHGVASIGKHFLIFDAIVSAMHVLGVPPRSTSWWIDFIRCFDAEYRYPLPSLRTKESGKVNAYLANRLLAAICIYKMGERPRPEEIIDLKRILLFSPYAPVRFRSDSWDPWREDHLLFAYKHPALDGWLWRGRDAF